MQFDKWKIEQIPKFKFFPGFQYHKATIQCMWEIYVILEDLASQRIRVILIYTFLSVKYLYLKRTYDCRCVIPYSYEQKWSKSASSCLNHCWRKWIIFTEVLEIQLCIWLCICQMVLSSSCPSSKSALNLFTAAAFPCLELYLPMAALCSAVNAV